MARAVLYSRIDLQGSPEHRQRVPASRKGIPLSPNEGLWKGSIVPTSGYWARIGPDYLALGDDHSQALDRLHEINKSLRAGRAPDDIRREYETAGEGVLKSQIAQFLEAKTNPVHTSRKIAPSTEDSYTLTLNDFAAFCERRGVQSVNEVTRQLVLDYMLVRKQTVGSRVLAKIFWQVHAFLSYHAVDVMKKGDSPRADLGEPLEFSAEDLAKLFASRHGNGLLWKFFAYTGMRRSEVAYVERRDLELDKGVVVVRSHPFRSQFVKQRAVRQIPLHPELIAALTRMLDEKKLSPRDLVFPNSAGVVDRTMGYKLFLDASRSGIEGAHLHRFRYTFASRCIINAGVDPITVMRWMGHSTINTTLRFYVAKRDAASESHRAAIANAFSEVANSRSAEPEPSEPDQQ